MIGNFNATKSNLDARETLQDSLPRTYDNTINPFYYYILLLYSIYLSIFPLSIYISLSPHISITQGRNHFPIDFISNLYTPSFLEYINSFYIMSLLQVVRICTTNCNTILRLINGGLVSMKRFMEVSLLVYITTINFILIVICNCSILNPGPNINPNSSSDSCFRIFYQNVHGFITYGSLGNKYPVLNITKLLEFQAYVSINQPDIIVLNETWLKHTITDAEIFPNNDYKIFRLDRTADSHRPDPNDRNKFKRNGGGILIAVNNCLEMKPKSLKSSSKAEILSILLQLKNNKKICITTCYRVGTLGEKNLAEISKHIDLVSSTKSIICHTLIGNMNLDSVNWLENSSPLHRQFLNIFDNHNLTQLINLPTHYLGNTLDI